MNYNIDYYKVLNINKNCAPDEIKKQYRALSKIYHPDISSTGNEDEFKKINEAFSILSNDKSKQEYDVRSPHGKTYTPFQTPFEFSFGRGQGFGGFGGFDPFEIFNDMFNNGYQGFANFRQKEEFRENLNIQATVDVSLKDIYLDTPLSIKYQKFVKCEPCGGRGFDNNSESYECEVCNGKGKDDHGFRCELCQGHGKVYSEICKHCNGEKVELKENNVTLNNVHAIRRNSHNEHGGYGHQSKYYRERIGNLILDLKFITNDKYEVKDSDLYTTLDVHFQDAIDGEDVLYDHVDDTQMKVKLPKMTKNGEYIRIKEKGLIKNNKKERADLYLKVNIVIDYNRILI